MKIDVVPYLYPFPDFHFTGRKNKFDSRNYNASNEINFLLNYGYAILKSEISKGINSVGLDYSIGFLHRPNNDAYNITDRYVIDDCR